MHDTISGTAVESPSRRSRRLRAAVATTVAASACAAAYVAGPAIAESERQVPQTRAGASQTFTATLKVCKVAGPGIPIGQKSTFDIYDQPANHFTVAAGPAPGGYCVLVGHFRPTPRLKITERTPVGTKLVDVAIAPATALTTDLATRTTTATLQDGMNVLTFTNAKVPTGYLEICKRVIGRLPSRAPYRFTVGGKTVGVPAGTCSPPMLVPAGLKTVTELPQPGSKLKVCSTEPAGALAQCNKAGREAKVLVAAGDISKETVVTFTNGRATKPVYLDICKVAGEHTAIGQHFPILVTRPDGSTELFYVLAGPAPDGNCARVGPFGSGERVNVSDLQSEYFLWTESLHGSAIGLGAAYNAEINHSRPASVDVTLTTGANRVTFRNDCNYPGSPPCLP